MKIIQINTLDSGGAFQAAYHLQEGLRNSHISSNFLVLHQNNNLKNVYPFLAKQGLFAKIKNSIEYRLIEKKHKKLLKNNPKTQFSFQDSSFKIHQHPLVKNSDLINLHWIANFLDYHSFFGKIKKPVVWTLHDLNPFSGGFHYKSYENINYKLLDEKIQKQKQQALKNFQNLNIVTPSKWLYQESKKSELFKNFSHHHIPYGLNTSVFKPYNKQEARDFFNLPQDKKIILFVADSLEDKRKGLQHLINALKILSSKNLFLITLGKGNVNIDSLAKKNLGFISELNKIAMAYSAADIFVIPSLEDNLPNTVLESLACGTPVVGFDVGGIPDMVRDKENGFLAELKNSDDLANKIKLILENDTLRKQISESARKIIEKEYSLELQAKRYTDLYKSILKKKTQSFIFTKKQNQ